ncbi:hypothetical protein ACJX0J_024595, partial [Zea mays]
LMSQNADLLPSCVLMKKIKEVKIPYFKILNKRLYFPQFPFIILASKNEILFRIVLLPISNIILDSVFAPYGYFKWNSIASKCP